jgi:hypothetical protein
VKGFFAHFPERGKHPAMDRHVRLFGAVASEVSIKDRSFDTTHVADFTTQFILARHDSTELFKSPGRRKSEQISQLKLS